MIFGFSTMIFCKRRHQK